MRTFGGRVNALSPMNVSIKGHKLLVNMLSIHMVGDAAAGITPDRADFGRLTLSRVGQRDDDPNDTQIVQNVSISALMALTEYLNGDILDTYAAGAACDAFVQVPFDVLPRLKPGTAYGLFLRPSDYLDYEIEAASAARWDALVHGINREELLAGESTYMPIFDQKPYSLSNVGEINLGKNTAYILLRPDTGATTSTITRIEVVGDGRQYARFNSWQELLDDTESRMEANAGATHGIIDLAVKGQDRPALANDATIEITGGSGTMQMIVVRVLWTPGSSVAQDVEQAGHIREMSKRIVESGGSPRIVEAVVQGKPTAATTAAVAEGSKAGSRAASNAAGTSSRGKLAVQVGRR